MPADTTKSKPKLLKSRDEYTIGIICALPKEARAVRVAFDFTVPSQEQLSPVDGDKNAYSYGTIGNYHVVLAHMSGMGKNNAKAAAENMARSFLNIKLCLLVGICGIVPEISGLDTVLGDVVVSTTVKQYDFGRQYPTGFEPKNTVDASLRKAPIALGNFLSYLEASDELHPHTVEHLAALELKVRDNYILNAYQYPSSKDGHIEDNLYKNDFVHQHRGFSCNLCNAGSFCQAAADGSCEDAELCCGTSELVPRKRVQDIAEVFKTTAVSSPERQKRLAEILPRVYLGTIASGDTVMKSGAMRDDIAKRHKVIAFEMEGAGVWDSLPTVVIKGACDYGDSHKNKKFQEYAALTAAACAKALLGMLQMGIPWNVELETIDNIEPAHGSSLRSNRPEGNDKQGNQAQNPSRRHGRIVNNWGNATFRGKNIHVGTETNIQGDAYFG